LRNAERFQSALEFCFCSNQRAAKAVLADFHSQHTLGDAGALLAAPQGPQARLWGWCASRARPTDPDRGLQAAGACEPRAALKAHASPVPGSVRLGFALRGRRGGGRTDVALVPAVPSPPWLLSRRPVGCGGARRGHGGDAE